jgi:C4-dicarboxylate-specific signal transduction histidine kinase
MVPASNPVKSPPVLPEWTIWIQVGLTALLAVLFLVILDKGRQQSAKVQLLEQRLQGLENSRALDRTTALEQQLRSAVERLQRLERNNSRIDSLTAESKDLQKQLFQLRTEALKQNSTNLEPAPLQPLQPLKPSPGLPSLNP